MIPLFEQEDRFNAEEGWLICQLPLPPADNQLTRSGRFSHYATAEYRDFLEIANERLKAVLGDWEPDRNHWWSVTGYLRMGVRDRDPANHLKATLDVLSGAYAPRKDVKDAQGNVIARKDVVTRPGLLWDDDCRVTIAQWDVEQTRHPEPALYLRVTRRPAPADYRELAAIRERERREAAQDEARAGREAVVAAKDEAKRADVARRTLIFTRGAWEARVKNWRGRELAAVRTTITRALSGLGGPVGESVAVTFSATQKARLAAAGLWLAEERPPDA